MCQQYIDAVNKLDQYDGNLKSQILQLLSDHSAEVSIRLEKFDDEFLRILHLLEKQERQKYVDAVNKLDRYPADVKARLLSNEFAKGMEKRWKKNCLCKEKVTSADKWFCSCAMDFIYIQAYIEVLQIKTTGRLRSLNRMGPDNLQSGIFEGDRAEQMLASRIDLLLKGECGLCCSKGLQQVICSCDMTELEAHVLIRCCIDLLKFQQEETGSRVLGAVLGNIGMEMAHEEVRERRSAYHNCKECKNSLNLFIRQYRLCICEVSISSL